MLVKGMLKIDRKICKCNNVYLSDINSEIEKGARSLSDIENKTGAMSRCGGCSLEVELIIKKFMEEKNNKERKV